MRKKLGIIIIIIISIVAIVAIIPKSEKPLPEFPTEEVVDETTIRYKVPETPVSHVMEAEGKEREIKYSDTTICATFDSDIRDMCTEVFGEYLTPLQESYELLEEAGYEYFVAFYSDQETCIKVPDTSLEFTIYLPGARGRFVITKTEDGYRTTFRILEEGELETTPVLDAGLEEEKAPTVLYGFSKSAAPAELHDYICVNDMFGQQGYVLFDGDEIADSLESIIDKTREVWGSDDVLNDALNYMYEISGEKLRTRISISEDGRRIVYGNYLFILSPSEGGVVTDVYKKK